MTREVVTRDSDGKTIDIVKEEAEHADLIAKAKKVVLIDSTGTSISEINPLPTTATITTGDIEIGAVEIKNATDDTRAVVSLGSLQVNDLIANSLVPAVYDYISLGYTDSNLTSVIFKTGGSGGTTVSTLTLAYDGSDNLISVTKT